MTRSRELESDEVLALVYEELRRLARARMAAEPAGHTLQPTALVHEAYVRLRKAGQGRWRSRGHFFGAAAEAMRRILIERARRYQSLRRGAGAKRVELDATSELAAWSRPEELLRLDDALRDLDTRDEQMAMVVKLRYFGGFSIAETAEAIGASERTVSRLWTAAQAWLRRELSSS